MAHHYCFSRGCMRIRSGGRQAVHLEHDNDGNGTVGGLSVIS
jgi:hypothetical protein